MDTQQTVYLFGDFRLDVGRRLLSSNGEAVDLGTRPLDLLIVLVSRRGVVVSKEELAATVWNGAAVEDNAIARTVSSLRKALGDGRSGRRFIATVTGRGYQFVAPVTIGDEASVDAPISRGPLARAGPAHARVRPAALAAAAIALSLTSGAIGWRLASGPGASSSAPASVEHCVAVLPFEALTDAAAATGAQVAGALIPGLAGIDHVYVRPTVAIPDPGLALDVEALGRHFKVDRLVSGTIRREGARVHVTVRVIDALRGTSIWAGTFVDVRPSASNVDGALIDRIALELRRTLAG